MLHNLCCRGLWLMVMPTLHPAPEVDVWLRPKPVPTEHFLDDRDLFRDGHKSQVRTYLLSQDIEPKKLSFQEVFGNYQISRLLFSCSDWAREAARAVAVSCHSETWVSIEEAEPKDDERVLGDIAWDLFNPYLESALPLEFSHLWVNKFCLCLSQLVWVFCNMKPKQSVADCIFQRWLHQYIYLTACACLEMCMRLFPLRGGVCVPTLESVTTLTSGMWQWCSATSNAKA